MAITAASDIVAASGLRGLTTRKVAAVLGYSPGSLYVIFANLDDLILHVNAATLDELRKDLQTACGEAVDPVQQLHAIAYAYLQFALTQTGRWLAVFEHHIDDPDLLPDWYHTSVEAPMMLVRAPVSALRGITDEADVALHTTAIWSAVHGVCVLGVGRKLDAGGGHTAKQVLATLLASLTSA